MIKVLSVFGLIALSPMASAVVIDSIDMTVRTSTYVVDGEDNAAGLISEFYNNGAAVCSTAIGAIQNVGSVQTCGGPNRNIATLFELDLFQGGSTMWQFGGDWGRGGALFLTNGGLGERLITEDIWWNYDWSNDDVIEFTVFNSGSYTLNLLGFEGCCGGGMSLRYSTDGGDTWTIAATAVPAPGALALLGFGLIGLGLARRRA
ncbi:MAG: CCXG family PEP-CTERM protein [Pseudomonadota bacterium]